MKRAEVIVGLVSALVFMLPILSSTWAATITPSRSEDEASMSKSNQAFTNQSPQPEGQDKEPLKDVIENSARDFAQELEHVVHSIKCSLGFCPPKKSDSEATPAVPKKPEVESKPVATADKEKAGSSTVPSISSSTGSSSESPEGTHQPETTTLTAPTEATEAVSPTTTSTPTVA